MGWNYRLVRKDHGGGLVTFGVHGAHCDEKGKVFSVSREPVGVVGYSKEEAAQNLHRMAEAFRAPILEAGTVPEEAVARPLENIEIRDISPEDLKGAGYDAIDDEPADSGRRASGKKPAASRARKPKGRAKKA